MKRNTKLKVKSLALTENEWKHLDKAAAKAARTRNNYLRQVVIQHLGQKTI